MTRPLNTAKPLAAYASAPRRLLLLDYDGTLTPIIHNAAEAILPPIHLQSLTTLASSPKNFVWVISGRDQCFLQAQLGSFTNIGLVAEHGAFMRRPQSHEWTSLAADADMGWKSTVTQAFEVFTSRYPVSFIEEKCVATVLHYRTVEQQASAERDAVELKKSLGKALERWDVDVMSGKCVLEARPAGVDKGEIVRRILEEMRQAMDCSPEFVFCAGDDVTDEDMFGALRATGLPPSTVFTVIVGAHDKVSGADYYLAEPALIWETIELFNKSDGGPTPFLKLL